MEAAVASATLSGTLKILCNKLAPLLFTEYSSILGAEKDLQELHDLVKDIDCWLEAVGHNAMDSGPSIDWLKKLKDVSCDVDDLVDEFQLEADKNAADGSSSKHIVSKYLLKEPKSFILQCKTAHKIKAIKKRFDAIVKQRADFSAITNSVPLDHPVQHINKAAREMPSLPVVDATSVFGRDQEKHRIVSKLVEANDQQIIKIVAIIGLGGSGKTTLASLVFTDRTIIQEFKVRLWVHVSQEFSVANLVNKLFENIAGKKSERYPLQHMIEVISNKLTGKRYLLVLDDVWVEDRIHWEEFMVHIKSGAPGSRIVLTTRSRKVAEAAISTDSFYLSFLSEVHSWEVFKQSFGTGIIGMDSEFLEVGREIVNKCGGVPLAIKVLAGVLRDKERVEEWKAIRDSNLLDVEDKERRVFGCLMLSYFHLPYHLKQCFTICSLFPKGHMIDKEQLIDLWIAHDMITLENGVDYLDYSGNKCFSSLLHMSFLQDVHEKDDGRIECTMHDLVHDLAISILGDEISLGVPKEKTGSATKYRYISIIDQLKHHPPRNIFGKARAIYFATNDDFTNDDFIFGKALENAKHLRSIIMQSAYTISSVPTAILQVKNLKYLCISGARCETLPEAISDIWSLQTLHADCSSLRELPKSIGKLKKLRALNLSYCGELESLPDSFGDCHMISRVDLHCCKKLTAMPNSIDGNKNLRVLKLGYTKIVRLPVGITALGNLECLDLQWCRELVELPEGFGNLKKLEVLNLEGCGCCSLYKMQKYSWGKLEGMPIGIGNLTRLRKLGLFVVGEGENSAQISELGNIGRIHGELSISNLERVMNPDDAYKVYLNEKTNLQTLKLSWGTLINKRMKRNGAVNTGNELAVLDGLEPPSTIQVLEMDGYAGVYCARWMSGKVDSGVEGFPRFPYLTRMRLEQFPNLRHLQVLTELPLLKEVDLLIMPTLESITGGPFPSLRKLYMQDLPSLEEVWIVTEEETLSDGEDGGCCSNVTPQLQIGNRLSNLSIVNCPKLLVKPYFPSSLKFLSLLSNNEQLVLSSKEEKKINKEQLLSSSKEEKKKNNEQLLSSSKEEKKKSNEPLLSSKEEKEKNKEQLLFSSKEEKKKSNEPLLSSKEEKKKTKELLRHSPGPSQGSSSSCDAGLLSSPECSSLSSLLPSAQHLASLQTLQISSCSALFLLPEWPKALCSLRDLKIIAFRPMSSLPQSLKQLTSLHRLEVVDFSCALRQLPDWIGEIRTLKSLEICGARGLSSLPPSLIHLTSLHELQLKWCDALQLPEWLGELRALRSFLIWGLPGLTRLPQSMRHLTSLKQLHIRRCPGLTSMPDWIQHLTTVQELDISDCPDLQRRCERGKGEDWHLISHIPRLHFW